MRKEQLSNLVGGACLVLVLALVLPPMGICDPGPEKPIVLKSVHWTADARMPAFGYWWFRDRIKERSKGELVVEHKGGNEAIPYKEQFQALRSGVVDVLLAPASFHFATYPFGQLTHLANLRSDGRLPKEVVDFLRERYEKIGVRFLGRAKQWQPWHIFLANKKVTTLADLSQLKIAVMGSAHAAFCKAIGAAPVTIGTTEIYTGLERGLVDGVQFGTDIHKLGVHEVVKYVVLPPYKTNNNISMYMNLQTWKKLPEHLQDVVTDVMITLETDGLARDIKVAKEHWQKLMDAGLKTTQLVKADAEKYVTLYDETSWEKVKAGVSPEEYQKMRKLAIVGEGPAGLPF